MTNPQVTLVQLDNYGPWTVTPEPRPEPDLQALQAELYADLSRSFGAHGAYTFFARFDNMVALTNGVTDDDIASIQESIGNRYPVTASFATAAAETPAGALASATERLQASGGAQDAGRTSVLAGEADGDTGPKALTVAHFDVVDATDRYTDRLDAFTTFARIERAYGALRERLYAEHDALTFFVGGDNAIAVCPDVGGDALAEAMSAVESAVDVELRVGIGHGGVATEAGMAAKHALETAREREVPVAGDVPARAER